VFLHELGSLAGEKKTSDDIRFVDTLDGLGWREEEVAGGRHTSIVDQVVQPATPLAYRTQHLLDGVLISYVQAEVLVSRESFQKWIAAATENLMSQPKVVIHQITADAGPSARD
jgi:phage tail protein X